ncbi:hypothetical protein [Sphingobium sp. B8D3B]|nr:hypothetical protein [Sphingobium sp. B8D3B]MCW2395903.1 hypothetical protein [Sphingobium sp. B8D3B]
MMQQTAEMALQGQDARFLQVELLLQDMKKQIGQISPSHEPKEPETPPPLKWAGMMASAVMTAGAGAVLFWLVSSVNEMQQTLVRIDERQKAQVETLDSRFSDHERRIVRLERASTEKEIGER